VLQDNISRANRILDRIEDEMENGNFTARMAEVAGQIINSVTNASGQIMSDKYNEKYLQVRNNLVKLKAAEVRLKAKEIEGKGRSNRELIVTDRESIMKILNGENQEEPKQIGESKNNQNDQNEK
jgi:hypothetical protein